MFLGYNFPIVKKVLEFRFWIIGFIGCAVFVSFMAYQQHRAAEKYKDHRAEYCAALVGTAEQKKACVEERTNSAYYLPWRYELFSWPEGITTWAIILTGFAIAWQSSETRKSANAALRSVKVQESGMGQWVDVDPLGCYIQTPPAGKRDFPFTINLLFEAVNNTNNTFDIQKIVTEIGMLPYEREVFTVETNVTLAFQEKSRSKRYAFYVPTQSITEEWFRKGTVVTINGEITFKNCLGVVQTDHFGGLYRCGQIDGGQQGMFKYMEALGIVPERKHERENQPEQAN